VCANVEGQEQSRTKTKKGIIVAKKLSMLFAAVAVLAFAIPAMASAAESTLTEAGTPVAVGKVLVGTNIGNVNLTSSALGTISCKKLTLKATVKKNEKNNVEAGGENASPPVEDCTNGTKTVVVTKVTLNKLASTADQVVTATFVATLDIGPELECTFTGTNVEGDYKTGTDIITFKEAAGIVGSPILCGTAKLDGEFTIETENGVSIILD
jgi:hypothetical protein